MERRHDETGGAEAGTGPPAAGTREEGTYAVLFDGTCPICVSSVSRLRTWDRKGVLRFVPSQDPGVEEHFPWIPPSSLAGALHLVGPEGETWEGAAAVEKVMRLLPLWRRGAWLFDLPLVRPLARRVYGWVAGNRYRLGPRG